jgi:tRNA dimethylallyltransferase
MVAIVGPTAVGKSRFSLALAARLKAEIVNADALQAYRGLEIGTAKPSAAEQAAVPHHLVDIVDPRQVYSAGDFARRARTIIARLRASGRAVLVVGGSGLYHRALFTGLAALPAVPQAVRRELKARLRGEGPEVLHRELASIDPAMAHRIGPRDGHRIVRALELEQAAGVSQRVAWQLGEEARDDAEPPLRADAVFGLTLPRELLYDQIEVRLAAMFAAGWEAEVESLLAAGISDRAPAFQAIGYRTIVRILAGTETRDGALETIARETRNYAKRQLTWFRRTPGVRWLDAERATRELDALVHSLTLTG